MIKTLSITISCLLLSTLYYPSTSIKESCKDRELLTNVSQVKTVVLDAGHGGKDDGCSGKHSKEKHLALDITLALGRAIETHYPSINVIYTRTEDVFIPLHERAAIANNSEADLFISIHCNALGAKLSYIRGTETFVMGLEESEHNSEVARRENEAILLEEDYQINYDGFDPNSNEGHIFLSMFQHAFLERSILLAEKIEKKVSHYTNRKSRGVRQAAFVVLKETTMPSVLIETGFLTNNKDEVFLSSKEGQVQIANAVFEAFKEYKTEVEQEVSTIVELPTEVVEARNPIVVEEEIVVVENSFEEIIVEEATETIETVEVKAPSNAVQKETVVSEASYRATEPAPSEVDVNTAATPESIKEELKIIATELEIQEETLLNTVTSESQEAEEVIKEVEEMPQEAEEAIKEPTISYTFSVQVAASTAPLATDSPQWQQIEDLKIQEEKNLYKYVAGSFEQYEQAAESRQALTKLGFKGAFVVAYKDGKRVSLKVARAAVEMP